MFSQSLLFADEGMWMLPKVKELNMDTLRKLGLKLTYDELYSDSVPSLKDAVIIFGAGCTGEFVSPEGLIFTNHHCGFDAIQLLSSVENDILKNGFWAKSKEEELPVQGLEISVLLYQKNITDSIIPIIPDTLDEDLRKLAIDKIRFRIEKSESDSGRYKAEVREFFGGNEYYLSVYEVYKDIRLVGAPPSSIGKFGADSDNWVWPRHTGDFSIFRAYTAANGKPAEFNKSNVPLKPKKYFPVSLKGIEDGSLSIIMGYPGSTERYLTSTEVTERMEVINKPRIKIRGTRQQIMLGEMLTDKKIQIQYASKYARSCNYWKYSIGQNIALNKLNVIESEKKSENDFLAWAKSDSTRFKKYGKSLKDINSAITARNLDYLAMQYYNEALFRGVEFISLGRSLIPLNEELQKVRTDSARITKYINEIKNSSKKFFKDFNPETDKKIAAAMFKLFSSDVQKENKFESFIQIEKKYSDNYAKFINKLYRKSFLSDSTKMNKFLNKPVLKALASDPGFNFTYNAVLKYRTIYKNYISVKNVLQNGQRLYIMGLKQMQEKNVMYPDANSTLRLTYGQVKGYKPQDAVNYNFYTTLKGVFEKEDSTNWEFEVPSRLKQLYCEKDYGNYGTPTEMPVCFISNNDITGGNSGSPVINANGQLIGIAFDGNWEAMSGDVKYEPDLQRTISVDIRYVLFIVDKYAGAGYLLNEMKIVY
jgi:hypothetical protein